MWSKTGLILVETVKVFEGHLEIRPLGLRRVLTVVDDVLDLRS